MSSNIHLRSAVVIETIEENVSYTREPVSMELMPALDRVENEIESSG